MFQGEYDGLWELSKTETVTVPKPLKVPVT